MKMVLIGAAALFLGATLLTFPQQATNPTDPAPLVRRLAATAQLAAQEYRLGIVDGRVVSPAEIDEARLFLQESRRSAGALPTQLRPAAVARIDTVIALVNRTGEPDSVDAHVQRLTTTIAAELGIVLDQIPESAPSLARGAEVYHANCASCHGALGRADGPAAHGLDPSPTNLADGTALKDQSPLDYYRRITIGVVGTAMPSFDLRLPAQDRWAAALYATMLRLPQPSGEVPPALRSFGKTGRMSDVDLVTALEAGDSSAAGLARVAAIRSFQPDASAAATAQVFDQVRAQLDSTYALARTGDSSAHTKAFDAYMTFEQVERGIRAKNPALAAELEGDFAALRSQLAQKDAGTQELDALRHQLTSRLENAERTLGDDLSSGNLFLQSLVIMLREGLEAILIVGALVTFLVRMGAQHRKREINFGVGAAIVASVVTAFAIETVFHVTPANQELLEGITMVVATVVLFYVSYWLLSKMEVVKWNHFVKSKVNDALTSGSSLALASAAFLAVYREGFETVLFYKALFLTGGANSSMPILSGILLGAAMLVGVYVAISRYGVRLPLKPFFGFTSAFLYYMAFVFAGKGVAELQAGGLVSTTMISWAPRLPALGMYPTLETMLAQGVLLVLLVVALVWTFLIEPHRPASAVRALNT
jgi:high-affinity iron transporter